MIVALQEQGRRQDLRATPNKVIRRRRSGGQVGALEEESSKAAGFPMEEEGKWTMLSCVCVCGKRDGFSWRRVDATCEQTFPYMLLALFSKERKAKPVRLNLSAGLSSRIYRQINWSRL